MEIWRDIKDFQNYQVSSQGRVRSVDHETEKLNNGVLTKHHYKGKVLKPAENRYGYLIVGLCKDGKTHTKTIHRLVAEAFLSNPQQLPEVNHRNENKHDNRVENLEYCSSEYNTKYGSRTERAAKSKSKPVGQFNLNGELVRTWPSAAEAGRNGFNKCDIYMCCHDKIKTHKTYTWRYL